MTTSIASIDIVHSTELAERLGDGREELFECFHKLVDDAVATHRGEVYSHTGDGSTLLFGSAERGLYACIDILEQVGGLSSADDDLPVYVRIGLATTRDEWLAEHSEQRRNRGESGDLFRVADLQKSCPVGRLAISLDLYQELGGRQSWFRQATSPILRDRHAFVYDGRQQVGHRHLLQGLTEEEAKSVAPIHTTKWARLAPNGFSLLDVPRMFREPLLVVFGETSRRLDSNHGSAATSDAVTVLELLARHPSNPHVTAAIDVWDDAADLAGQRNVLLVGSGQCNAFSFAVNDLVDILRFDKHGGKIFPEIIAKHEGGDIRFGSRALVGRYCGLLVHCISPFNLHRRLVWAAGLTGRGTQAAMRFLERLSFEPEAALGAAGLITSSPPIAAVVTAMDDASGSSINVPSNRRITDYQVLAAVTSRGDYLSLHDKAIPTMSRAASWGSWGSWGG